MFDSLHDIYPLLVAAAVAVAVPPLSVRQESPEKLPRIARVINEGTIIVASSVSVIGAFLAMSYVMLSVHEWLIITSFYLILTAYLLLVIAFMFPLGLTVIHPWWRALFYRAFEEAQSRDQKEVQSPGETAE